MKTKIISVFLAFVFLLFGCGNKKQNSINQRIELDHVAEINRIDSNPAIINTNDSKKIKMDNFMNMIKSIHYIPLDSHELIGEIGKMIVSDDKIFIMDSSSSQKVLAFDKKGHLLFSIKGRGQGPKEYTSIWDIQIDMEHGEIILNDALARNYIYYSINDGDFIRKEKGISNCYVNKMNGMYYNILAYGQDFNENENWQILVTDKDSVLYKAFMLEPIQKNNYIVNSFHYDCNGELLFTPLYSDTIYQINNDRSYLPKYVIHQKKSLWKKKNETLPETELFQLIKESNYTRFSGHFISSEHHSFFQILNGEEGFVRGKNYIWNREKDLLYEWVMGAPDVVTDIVLYPVTSHDNVFYAYFSSEGLLKHYGSTLSRELVNTINSSDKDGNPIIVAFEFVD